MQYNAPMIEVRASDNVNLAAKRRFRQVIIVTLVGNVVLAVGKGIAAYFSGSAALFADAANSVSDVLYSFLIVFGLTLVAKPPDRSHPQGHSRFEPLLSLVITITMSIAAYEAGRNAVDTIIAGARAIPLELPGIVLVASALLKALMYFLIQSMARKQNSPSLRAIATDNLTDIVTSLGAFGGAAASNLLPILDPIAGLLVAVYIAVAAVRTARENLVYLTGGNAPTEVRDEIIRTAESVPGVRNVHHLITEYIGPKLIVDMHCDIDPRSAFVTAHALTDEIVARVEALPDVDRAYIHLEPGKPSRPIGT